VLYWFRTPPGVKVGRAALDEDAIRLIEQLNPDIEFDWTRILKGQGVPATESRPLPDVRRSRPDNRRPQPSNAPPPPRAARPPVREEAEEIRPAEAPAVAAEPEPVVQFASAGLAEQPSAEEQASEIPTPAHAKLGSEGVQRLRARYAEILVRISERAAEPSRREELKLLADRLNPDAWVTGDEVVQGLEQYESVFASLREVVGQKRRRRRRGSRPRQGEPGSGTPAGSSGVETSGGADRSDSGSSPEDTADTEDGDGGDLTPGES
jgi:hypothetical protein